MASGTASYALLDENHLEQTGSNFCDTPNLGAGTYQNSTSARTAEVETFDLSGLTQILLTFDVGGKLGGDDSGSVLLVDLTRRGA